MSRIINYYNSTSAPDEFVGARVYESHIDFYFPHGYITDLADETECRKKAIKILYLISLATPSTSMGDYSSQFDEAISSYPIKSFIWLIKDYLDNGLAFSLEKKFKKGYEGKINWSRTFKETPFATNDSFVYLTTVADYKAKTDNMLTSIHEYCLNMALREVGWLFGDLNIKKLGALSDAQKLYYIRYLLKEQKRSFVDHKKVLIGHLLRILKYSLGKKDFKDRSEVGTYKFSYIWERMIQKNYGNKPLNEFFPNAIWHIDNEVKDGSHLRPDTVMEYSTSVGKNLLILDAKYYKYGLYSNCFELLPGSSDVQKQITYGDHAKLRHKEYDGRIKNAFVLPFHSDSKEKIKTAGYAESSWRDNRDSYQRVYLLLMDTDYLIESFLAGQAKKNKQKEIVDIIERFIYKNPLQDKNN